jgi:cupin fold WbuC family metalloprotein
MNFRIEKKGVFYTLDKCEVINDDHVDFLVNECKKEKLNISRICLHDDHNSEVMAMLVVVVNRFRYPIHKHKWKDEVYFLLRGKAIFEGYSNEGGLILQKRMETGNVILNNMQSFHALVPLTNVLAFVETTKGPFKQSQQLEIL